MSQYLCSNHNKTLIINETLLIGCIKCSTLQDLRKYHLYFFFNCQLNAPLFFHSSEKENILLFVCFFLFEMTFRLDIHSFECPQPSERTIFGQTHTVRTTHYIFVNPTLSFPPMETKFCCRILVILVGN